MAEGENTGPLNWQRAEQIAVPAPQREGRFAIRRADWDRLVRCVNNLDESGLNLQIVYSILIGVSVSFGASIVPLRESSGLPAWVIPFYVCMTGFSLVTALLCVLLDRERRQRRASSIEDIAEDMREIQNIFAPDEPAIPAAHDHRPTGAGMATGNRAAKPFRFQRPARDKPARPTPEPDVPLKLVVGLRVRHPRFGVGEILSVTPKGETDELRIRFESDNQTRTLMSNFAPLEIV
jgi:hypothetical protein